MNNLRHTLTRWPTSYLTSTELAILLDGSPDSSQSIIYRAMQANYLTRLKRGLYLVTQKIRSDIPDTKEIAQVIYGPSYISFETSLSFHSWIPEGVTVLTCACSKRGKEFNTPLGPITYERVPKDFFFLGIKFYKTPTSSYMMAKPWRALADLIYTRHLDWPSLAHITKDLRIETEDLQDSDLVMLEELSQHYPSKRTRDCLQKYVRELQK